MAIKESLNKINVQGILLENNLEQAQNEKLGTFISGTLVVRVGDSDIPVNFFSKEIKKDGGLNKIFISLKKLMLFPSVATDGEGVKVNMTGGAISGRDFYTDDLELISYSELKCNFCKKSTKNYIEEAKFEFEGIVRKVYDEIKNDQETDRLVVEIVGVNYAETALPVKFVVAKEKAIAYIKTYYASGKTVKVNGDIIYTTEKIKKVTESAFGDDIVKIFDKVTKDFIITAGTQPYDENDYSQEAIQKIMQNRNIFLEGEKAKKVAKMNSKNSAPNSAPTPNKETETKTGNKDGFPF
ncbi:MAG: hypothetical protein KQ78_01920 [Candidatus Izimaplasma bacterium HR2]|nr:MAG: hypothetical protein KQ78_01920 [Candidatus Izimaplasma bacterium HR2]